ncbi:MAG: DegT/DnrJ/EryC1/StrS family aminotransferase [Nitrospiraceae bacterium]|nr:DegT/DnrJ/EryC1/StrS family aminotransferase [Nitrospiraceae bacterium]
MEFIHQVVPYVTGNEARAVSEYILSGGWLTEFEKTRDFERAIAEFLGVRHAVVVPSGTVGLYLALLAAGVGPGDSVIVPNYTMIASPNSVRWTGAKVRLCDVESGTLCADLEKASTDRRTKALMYVSINGRCGDMDVVARFCRANGIFLIEDACQAFGSRWRAKALGTFGDAGVLSFTPHKIITTGQGGAVVTDNEELYREIVKLKDFGRTAPATDWHDRVGFNFKFTDLQSVIGIEQMKLMDFRIKRKKQIYARYEELLAGIPGIKMLPTDLGQTPPWFVDIILPSRRVRDGLAAHLKERKIGTRPFYPPISHQEIYAGYPEGAFPVSESIAHRGLWLPSSIGLKDEEIEYITDAVRAFLS